MARLHSLLLTLVFLLVALGTPLSAQERAPLSDDFEFLRLRNLGPALVSGRISDVAVDPENRSVWYVGVSAGNVWKTENRGTTWTPIFDDYGSYSIVVVTVDSLNPATIFPSGTRTSMSPSATIRPDQGLGILPLRIPPSAQS
jgi:hypothetical protein